MLPSVCAARLRGCTAMPASSAAQKLCTLILPVLRSSETSATPAASVSSFTMVPTPSAVPSRLRVQSDISATTRKRCCMRGTPSESSSRNATGSLPRSLAISSTKLSIAKALWPLPTPRHGDSRAPPVLDHVLGELVGNRILRDRRALHHDAVLPRLWIAGDVGHDGFGNHAVMPGDRACRRRRSRPRCDARSSGGTCRR